VSPADGAQPAVSSPTGLRRGKALVVVLAGGEGGRLGPLTRHRSKPSLPFAGMYRLIDVALTNVAHSELDDVWVLEQFEPHDLNDHLANGRPWDLDRTHGGMRILPPFQRGDGDEVMSAGNADALVQHRHLLAQFAPELIVTLSADHLFQLDLRDAIDTHRSYGAAVTMVTTGPPAGDDQSRFAWAEVTDGVVTGFEYKPDEPSGDRVCTEVFVFDAADLLGRLEALPDDGSAGDYGDALIPDLVADGRAFEHRLHGYWRDIGTIGAYHRHCASTTRHGPSSPGRSRAAPLTSCRVQRFGARCSVRVRWLPEQCTTAWWGAAPSWKPERSFVRASSSTVPSSAPAPRWTAPSSTSTRRSSCTTPASAMTTRTSPSTPGSWLSDVSRTAGGPGIDGCSGRDS
jgi:ADP-glucose pyrophosphorylase